MKKPTQEDAKAAMQYLLPDSEFKVQFQLACDSLLPDLGEDNVIPKLIIIHVLAKESDKEDQPIYGVDFVVLALDDFNDKRHDHLEQFGFKTAREKKQVVMLSMVSEAWVSYQEVKPGEKRKYTAAGDDPDRQEAIVVFASSIDRRMAQAKTIVTRDQGNYSAFSDLEVHYSFESGPGLRTELLDKFWRGFQKGLHKP